MNVQNRITLIPKLGQTLVDIKLFYGQLMAEDPDTYKVFFSFKKVVPPAKGEAFNQKWREDHWGIPDQPTDVKMNGAGQILFTSKDRPAIEFVDNFSKRFPGYRYKLEYMADYEDFFGYVDYDNGIVYKKKYRDLRNEEALDLFLSFENTYTKGDFVFKPRIGVYMLKSA